MEHLNFKSISDILNFRLIILLLIITLFFSFDSANSNYLSVGKNGNIKCIVIPDESDEITRFAAKEIQVYLEKMTGFSIPVKQRSTVENNVKSIHFVRNQNNELTWDGYSIETDKNGITISANESRGLLYAVYTLLEEAGCSFFYPGRQEEIVPHKVKIEFKMGSGVFNPQLEYRGLTPYGLQAGSIEAGRNLIDWMAKNRMNFILVSEDRPSDCPGPAHSNIWKEVSSELLPELQKRGFVIDMSEHCTHVFFPRSLFDVHPDWFALNGGERKLGKPPYSGQMCYSNKEAVEYYATAIADYAAKHKEFHIIGTWPLDGGEYCECENCKDNQTVFNASRRVAEKVKKVRPDMLVEYLAYKPQTWQPPQIEKIPDNMSVLWCPDNGKMDDLAQDWIRKSSNAGGVYQFEYYMGDNYRSRANVLLRPVFSTSLVKHARLMGFRGVVSLFLPIDSWWRSAFNNWFFAKTCWNPAFDVNDGLHDYCTKFYGKYANEIEGVFNTIFSKLHPELFLSQGIESYLKQNPQIKATSTELLNRIDKITAVSDDPELKVRLTRLRTYVEFHWLFTDAFSRKQPEDLERLINYCRQHADQNMVLMYPEYIRWRNENTFRNL